MEDTPRRLSALVYGLPMEAAVWREDQLQWTQGYELAATQIEVADAWGRQIVGALAAVHGGKVRFPEPLRIEHPDRPQPEKPPSKAISVAAFEQLVKGEKGGPIVDD